MTSRVSTYISLPGQTAEAFTHWHEVFGGELNILKYADQPMEGMPFEPDPTAVAHATLNFPGGSIAGGDSMDPENTYPVEGTAYSLLVTVDSPEEGRELIAKIVDAGGEVGMPFEQAPWGDFYGSVFDKFRVMWSFSTN